MWRRYDHDDDNEDKVDNNYDNGVDENEVNGDDDDNEGDNKLIILTFRFRNLNHYLSDV